MEPTEKNDCLAFSQLERTLNKIQHSLSDLFDCVENAKFQCQKINELKNIKEDETVNLKLL